MHFEFICWRCGAECLVWGKPVGFWTERYRLDSEWSCWCCGAINSTPED